MQINRRYALVGTAYGVTNTHKQRDNHHQNNMTLAPEAASINKNSH